MTIRLFKSIKLTLLCTLLISMASYGVVLDVSFADSNTPPATIKTFTDMTDHWGIPYVEALVQRQVIDGFPDGTFKPQGTVTVAEFTKILITSLGHAPKPVNGTGHWARGYMAQALDQGLTFSNEKEFQALNTPLTRGQLARMLYRALPSPLEFQEMVYHQYMIKDFVSCDMNDRLAILNCFKLGIITGYPDSTIRDKSSVTRAEAAAMMMRYLDETLRKVPELPYAEGVTITESEEKDRAPFYIAISLSHNLENQYQSVKVVLEKYFPSNSVDKILTIIRKKTEIQKEISPISVEGTKYLAQILSAAGNNKIVIRGLRN